MRLGRALLVATFASALARPALADAPGPGLVRLLRSPSGARHALADARGKVSLTARLPRGVTAEALGMLAVAPGVGAVRLLPEEVDGFQAAHASLSLRAAPERRPLLDKSGVWTRATEFRTRTGLDGAGVVVGIIDTGLDVRHADFRNADGSTRVAWMLQAGSPVGKHAELESRFGCSASDQSPCRIYDRANLDAMLTSGEVDAALNDKEGHGTHVTSIAAGNGGIVAGTPRYVGIAPGATIIVASPVSPSGGFADADILNAARFVFDRADALGAAAVVNLSVGSDFGPHDGSSDLEAGLAALVGDDKPGRVIVVAAGNSGSLYSVADDPGPFGVHTEAHASPNALTRVPIVTDAASGTQAYVWITFRPGDEVSVGLEGPDGSRWIGLTEPGKEVGYRSDSGATAAVINNVVDDKSSLNGRTNGAIVALDGSWPKGELAVLLSGRGDAQLWLAAQGSSAASLLFRRALRQGTINVPASDPSLLAVGCTVSRVGWQPLGATAPLELSEFGADSPPIDDSTCYFSSAGPTPAGVQKPEISAPGAFIAAAMSSDADPRTSFGGLFDSAACPDPTEPCFLVDQTHAIATGTSMSAPHVAGAVALLLQKEPNLTQARVTEVLQAGARYPTGKRGSDAQAGVGGLDLMGALDALAEDEGEAREPDVTKSWYSLSSGYARPDPSWPVWGTVELRHADGSLARGLGGDALTLEADGGVVTQPLTKVRPGMWRFAIAGARGSGGGSIAVAVRYDGRLIGEARALPIGADAWQAGEGARAAGGGCAVGGRPSTGTVVWAALPMLGLLGLGRRRRGQA